MNTTVYISNLSYNRDRNGLRSLFERFGTIKSIKIIVEPSTNQSRGMAFVEMGNADAAKIAIEELDGKAFDGRVVKARWAIPQVGAKATKEVDKDLTFKDRQIAKKARNDTKRKSNPFIFKK
jgi:RNA recognition motif-containing protein